MTSWNDPAFHNHFRTHGKPQLAHHQCESCPSWTSTASFWLLEYSRFFFSESFNVFQLSGSINSDWEDRECSCLRSTNWCPSPERRVTAVEIWRRLCTARRSTYLKRALTTISNAGDSRFLLHLWRDMRHREAGRLRHLSALPLIVIINNMKRRRKKTERRQQ